MQPMVFDKSIFKQYHEEYIQEKQVKSTVAPPISILSNTKTDSIDKLKGKSRETMLLKIEPNKIKSSSSFERFLGVMVTSNKVEDSRKLARMRCNNSIVRSYLKMDEDNMPYNHPHVSDFQMVRICSNNKTSCCNYEETQKIKDIFDENKRDVLVLIKKFKKVVTKLSK